MPETLATWEDMEALKQRFPATPAWGQAVSKGRGNVRTATATSGELLGVQEEPDKVGCT
jgi:hypothetical protein